MGSLAADMARDSTSYGAEDPRVAVVIPCYRVKRHILDVVTSIPQDVDLVFCVDDACPEGTASLLEANCRDTRVRVLRHRENQGVGAATTTGYRAALAEGADIVVKLDGGGQMDPADIPYIIDPIQSGSADYAKGNRFYRPESLAEMPAVRLVGNAILSFMCKLSTGYWHIFDPTNGYTAIASTALRLLPLEKLSKRYFFESDMLFRLGTVRAVVVDVAMDSRYEETSKSSLSISRILVPFLFGHVRNFFKRLLYNYFVRDFNVASILTVVGVPLFLFGVTFGAAEWRLSELSGKPATGGTVMLAALPIVVGLQMILSALNYDVANVPSVPLHRKPSKAIVPAKAARKNGSS